jgi:hypothetical protein
MPEMPDVPKEIYRVVELLAQEARDAGKIWRRRSLQKNIVELLEPRRNNAPWWVRTMLINGHESPRITEAIEILLEIENAAKSRRNS